MTIAALVTWIIAAALGFTMLAQWASQGGAQPNAASHFRPPVVFGHFALAAAGLVVWVVYVFVDNEVLPWIAFADLVVVATLGDLLVLRWLKDRRASVDPGSGAPVGAALAEQRFSPAVVALHGVFAVATVVLVFLTALGVGES
jgi:hypothetical protein